LKRLISALFISLVIITQLVGCSGKTSVPITVVSVNKYIDTKGSQQLNIIVKNTSQEYTIKSAQVYVKCYSVKNTLLSDRANGQDVYACTYSQSELAPGQLSSDNLFFDYSGFDSIDSCKIAVKSVTLNDGTELSIETENLDYLDFSIGTIEN